MAKTNKKKGASGGSQIAVNKRARFEYKILEEFEAGLSLEGWEVKSLRAGKVQLTESYVLIRHGELYLFGCYITPLPEVSTHKKVDPTRNRKLLLHRREINYLIGAVERKGNAITTLGLYWSKGRVKLKIALATGKKEHDKRETIKQREWNIEKQRLHKMNH